MGFARAGLRAREWHLSTVEFTADKQYQQQQQQQQQLDPTAADCPCRLRAAVVAYEALQGLLGFCAHRQCPLSEGERARCQRPVRVPCLRQQEGGGWYHDGGR